MNLIFSQTLMELANCRVASLLMNDAPLVAFDVHKYGNLTFQVFDLQLSMTYVYLEGVPNDSFHYRSA